MGVHGLKELLDFLPGMAAGGVPEQGVFLDGVLMVGVAEDACIFRSPQVGEGPGGFGRGKKVAGQKSDTTMPAWH